MKNQKTLSVIITNYNYGYYISEALEDILNQSFKPNEVVLVDDASTDNSIEIINEFLKKYSNLKLLRNDRNMGLLYSSARAFESISGDYIYAAASDDRVLPGFFEKSMRLLYKYPSAGLCCSDLRIISDDTSFDRKYSLLEKPGYLTPALFTERSRREKYDKDRSFTRDLTFSTIVKREALIKAGGYLPELKWSCDFFAHNVVGLRHGICYIPEPLVCVREHQNQFGGWRKRDRAEERKIIMNMLDKILSDEYSDVLESFLAAGTISNYNYPSEVLRAILSNRKYWKFFTMKLYNAVPFDEIKSEVLGPILKSFPIRFKRKEHSDVK